jgi:hypothetical protein
MKNKKSNNTILIYNSTVTKVDKVWLCYGQKEYIKFSEARYKSFTETIEKGGLLPYGIDIMVHMKYV